MRRRRMFIIIGIVLILAVLGVGGFFAVRFYNQTIDDLRAENEDLRAQLDAAMIEMGTVVVVGQPRSNDMGEVVFAGYKDGERIISEEDLDYIEIPAYLITDHMMTDAKDVVGKITKIDLKPGAIFEDTMLMDYEIHADDRELDIVLTEMPIGLEPGDYVDLRVSFPLGEDFVCMVKKRVAGINSNTVKLIVNEEDVHHYESVKADMALYTSTKLYTTKYIEFGLQPAASTYYPVTNEVMKTLIQDPNINTEDWKQNVDARYELEMELSDLYIIDDKGNYSKEYNILYVTTNDTAKWNPDKIKAYPADQIAGVFAEKGMPIASWPGNRVEKAQTVTQGRADLNAKFNEARSTFEQMEAEKEREARYYNY